MDMNELLQQPAESFINDSTVEVGWAMKTFQHAETYFNLITAVDPKLLKLTQMDDIIYTSFRNTFKDLNVEVLTDDQLKNPKAKEEWREFCMQFNGQVEDYNMGTLLRLDANGEISDKNTTIVPRIQFLAIEISRNREGYNSGLREKYKKAKDSGDKS